MKIGDKVRVTLKHVQQHGNWYGRYLGQVGVITARDKPDSDGERVFGVKFSNRQYATLAESQMELITKG